MIQAKIIADSKSVRGERITTFLLTFPRIILAEFNTHRVFSRNSASSRAIPFKKMGESVENNPFIPIAWQKDHKGMQGTEYLATEGEIAYAKALWLGAAEDAVQNAKCLHSESAKVITKQICNRLLEPFMWHTVICTATDYSNFFKLRCPEYQFDDRTFKSKKDIHYYCNDNRELDWLLINKSQAEIHIQALAEAMWDAMNESTPKVLNTGEWHIPFGDNIDLQDWYNDNKRPTAAFWNELEDYEKNAWEIKVATARCARVSYTVVGSSSNSEYKADIDLYNRLLESGHMSPFEHCAQVMEPERVFDKPYSRNFRGFVQYREIVEASLH